MAEATPSDELVVPVLLNELPAAATTAMATSVVVAGTIMSDHWRRQAQNTQRRFMDLIRESINSGESTERMASRVSGGVIEGIQVRGIMDTTRQQARALVRTGANAILNTARVSTFQENSELISGTQQVSTLDNRTSEICIAYSGQAWGIDDLEPIPPSTLPFNGGPPRHFNCRSTLVPIIKAWEQLSTRARNRIGPGQRASIDGQVPGDITFDAWLRGKSKSFQDELLGVGKARLWRRNKITLTQLVDMRGDPLTLSQLEAKLGL